MTAYAGRRRDGYWSTRQGGRLAKPYDSSNFCNLAAQHGFLVCGWRSAQELLIISVPSICTLHKQTTMIIFTRPQTWFNTISYRNTPSWHAAKVTNNNSVNETQPWNQFHHESRYMNNVRCMHPLLAVGAITYRWVERLQAMSSKCCRICDWEDGEGSGGVGGGHWGHGGCS